MADFNETEEIRGRYDSEIELFEPVTNTKLICKDCVYAYKEANRVTKCFEYPSGKPGNVIYGGFCNKYSKE